MTVKQIRGTSDRIRSETDPRRIKTFSIKSCLAATAATALSTTATVSSF